MKLANGNEDLSDIFCGGMGYADAALRRIAEEKEAAAERAAAYAAEPTLWDVELEVADGTGSCDLMSLTSFLRHNNEELKISDALQVLGLVVGETVRVANFTVRRLK